MEQPNLRALTVGEILDRALRIYRAKFFQFLGIVAVTLIPQGILRLVATYYLDDIRLIDSLMNLIFQNLAMLALIVALSNANLQKEFTINSSYSVGIKRFWTLIGANILMGLAIGGPVVVIALCVSLVVPFGFIGIILLMPFAIFIATRWSLSSQAIVLEHKGAADSLSRSWDLTKDFFWRVLGTSFLASLLSLMLTVLPSLVVGAVLEMMDVSSRVIALVGVVIQQTSVVIVLPFTVAVNVLIYYDLRIRKEGFDLMLRAEENTAP